MGAKKGLKVTLILSVLMVLMAAGWPQEGVLQLLPVYAETADDYVTLGRQAIGKQNIVAANSYFKSALEQNPSHEEANLYYSVTRIAALVYQHEFNRLLDGFGVDADGRDLYNWTAQLPHDMHGNLNLPANSPTGGDITEFIEDTILDEINAALANLDQLEDMSSDPVTPITVLTPEMIGTDEDFEVDYGDVALYRSFLNTTKTLLLILTGYDLNIDIDDIIAKTTDGTLDIKTDLIEAYPEFLKLRRSNLSGAKNALIESIDAYLAALEFIRNEADPQDDDLIAISDFADENEFRWALDQIRRSLLGEVSDPFKLELSQFVHFGWLFDNPVELRSFLCTESLPALIKAHIHPQINWALTHLEGLDGSYEERLEPSDYPIENTVEIDFGDIALFRSLLYALRSGAKTSYSYDINLKLYDLVYELANESFSINEDVLYAYKDFLNLMPDQELDSAKTDLNNAINNYIAGSDFIRTEADDQSDDLFKFDDDEAIEDDANRRALLSAVQTSLAGNPVCLDPETPVQINLFEFYGDPIDLRAYLPEFDRDNEVVPNTFPDPTFSGVFPDFSQETWMWILKNGERPQPAIAANGSNDFVNIKSNENLKIAINLNANYKIANADWWLLAATPFGWFHYQVENNSWAPDITCSYQGPLFNLGELNVLNTPLPAGTYTVYFGVDMDMNGTLDLDQACYEYVSVNIE